MENGPGAATPERAQLEELASAPGFWWHSIDLGHGVVTRGTKTPEALRRELDLIALPDLRGKTVLDIGAYDGFYSFEAERRGASRVVALDHYVWSLDLPGHIRYWRECRERGVVALPTEQTPYWQPDRLPGKKAFDAAHRALRSRVEAVVGNFMTMDLASLGTFDVVLFLGVLYHMENPLASLRRVAALAKEVAILETHAVATPGYENLEICEFYSSNQLNDDVTNWWGPNVKALQGMCRAAGFSRVDVTAPSTLRKLRIAAGQVVRGMRAGRPLEGLTPRLHFRVGARAWK